ncbi:hypothetical protein B9Z55_004579 [Caenorhabditis nigoni]|nr:hypothetical protein B9Z55_004579 [Caenorhabditis nigoni]
MIASNPTLAARKLTQRNNIHAKYLGDGYISIQSCSSIPPSSFSFVPFTKKCYSNPSVQILLPTNISITTFIDLATGVITNRAHPVDCPLVSNFEYIVNGSLVSLNPFTLVSTTNPDFHPILLGDKAPLTSSALEEDPLIFRNLIIGSMSENIPDSHYNEVWEALQGSPEAITRIISAHSSPTSGPLAPTDLEEIVGFWSRFKKIWSVVFYVWTLLTDLVLTLIIAAVAIVGVAGFYASPWLSFITKRSQNRSSDPLNSISVVTTPTKIEIVGPNSSETTPRVTTGIPDCAKEMKRLKSPRVNVLSFEGPKFFTAQIPIRVNGISCWALIDTGAGFTVASQEICALIGVARLNPSSVDHALGLGGNEVEMAGSATVRFEIGSNTIFQTTHFTIGQCTPEGTQGYEFILGNDILQRLPKFHLNYAEGCLEIGDEKLPLGTRPDTSIFPSRYAIHISRDTNTNEPEVELDPEFAIDLSHTRLTDVELEILKSLLEEFHDVFSKNAYDLGSSKTDPVHIYTNTEIPIKGRPYRVPAKYQAELEKHINSLLRSGRITESNTPWVSPIVLVKKKNGSLRVCLDFRKLNEATIPDHFPLPRIDAILEKVGGSSYFTSLDMANGYLQLRLDPASSYKCGFVTENKVYAYTHLPFGLKSAASYFQRALRTVLGGLEDEVLVYIDDILVFSKTFEQHLESLRKVLHRFRTFNLKASPKKCEFAKASITFLGHEINKSNYAPDKANVAKILEFPVPSNVNEIRRFVGMAGFFRKFIPNFSDIAEPLTRLTRKEKKFTWDMEQQESFEKLRDVLVSEPILGFPDYDKPFHIFCDASAVAQGAALMQTRPEDEKDYCVIAYTSRTLSDTETRWPAIQVEMGAIIFALRQFRPYVCLSKIILHSDHKPLTFLLQKSKTHDNLARWLIELQCYDISIIHVDGKKNTVADCLSRARENEDPTKCIELKDIVEFPVCMKIQPKPKISAPRKNHAALPLNIVEEQEKDPEIQILRNVLLNKSPLSSLSDAQMSRLELSTMAANGTLLTKPHSSCKKFVLYVPKQLTNLIFEAFHESYLSGGHFNWRKTKSKIIRRYFWPDMSKEIFEKSRACPKCQAKNPPNPSFKEKLVPVVTSKVFQKVGLDLAGPLRTTERNNKYILNIICWFSKFVISVPLPDARSDTVARALLTECVLRYGAMTELVSDNATTFTSNAFGEFCELLKIQHHKAIPYHSKGNGATERSFRTFHQLTSKYVNKTHTDWDIILPALVFCYNTTTHDTTGETPFFLMHGRDPIFSIDQILDPSPSQLTDEDQDNIKNFRQELTSTIREAWTNAKEHADKAREQFSKTYDAHSRPSEIEVGDRVLFKNYKSKVGLSRKLVLPWIGQYRVIEINRPEALIQDISNPSKPPQRVHLDQIKKFIEMAGPAATRPDSQIQPTMPSRVCFDDQAFYRHRHPIWPSAPMLQVCVLLYKIEGVTHAKAFVDQSPFEFAPSSTRPILEYAMIDGILVRQRAGTGFNQRHEEVEGQGTASFHTASVQTWTRHQPHGPRLRCTCSPHYTTEMQNHTDPMMCAARTIGHRIADRIWANQPIAGLRVRLSHSSV